MKKIKQDRVTVGSYARDREKLNKILIDIDKRLSQLERLCTRILTVPKSDSNKTIMSDIIEAAKENKPDEDNTSEPKEKNDDTM